MPTADTSTLLNSIVTAPEFSCRVLISTVFGDALLPRRQPIGVLALAELLRPFGVNDRLVRTSLHRLAREELVVGERRGRQSFYRVSEHAEATFDRANRRIYGPPMSLDTWDERWTIAVLDPAVGAVEQRSALAQELRWMGLVEAAPLCFTSPMVGPDAIRQVADDSPATLAALVRAELLAGTTGEDAARAAHIDPDGSLLQMHERHAARLAALADHTVTDPAEAFAVRTLLIDSWRRIALRSPLFPERLAPAAWPAAANHAMTGAIHIRVHAAAEEHLDRVLGPADAASPVSPFENDLRLG